jgi:uroporphyrinogen-III synthase
VATTWLITREADDAREEREAWSARGVATVSVPCVETLSLPWPWARGAETNLLTLFTSRRAVSSWLAAGKPRLGAVAALAPATSQALLAEGVQPDVTAEGGVIALAQSVLAWWKARGCPPTRVHYPTSNAGLHAPEQTEALRLLSKLVEVDRQLAYEVRAPEGLKASLERAVEDDWAVTFSSPSAVHHFLSAGAALGRAPAEVVCRGGSTLRAWNSARPTGWPEAVSSNAFSTHPEATS